MSTFAVPGRMVNRRPQQELLWTRYLAALGGQSSSILIAGEAGAGKSRLIEEFLAEVGSQKDAGSKHVAQARCVVGRCLEYAQSPFAPFLTFLEKLLVDEPSVLRDATTVRQALAPLLPELRDPSSTTGGGDVDKLRQFSALSEAIRLFSVQPLVVVIEDLHWADNASLELLLHLHPLATSSRLLLIATYRSDELSKSHPLRSVVAKLQRHPNVYAVELQPLTEAETRELIQLSLGDRKLPAGTTAAICSQADGNPLFAEELVKAVIQNAGETASAHVPATLRQAIHDRLAGFDETKRATLIYAAAIGRQFRAPFLAQIAQAPIAQAISTLKEAMDAQFIIEHENGDITYTFRHELLRSVLHGELLASEARPLHRRIAQALESSNDAEKYVAELAYHYWRARDLERASHYNEIAGDKAFAVFAYQDSATAYERALKSEADNPARRAMLNRKLAQALHGCGYSEPAKHALEEALAYYESSGDAEQAAQVCLSLALEEDTLGDADAHRALAERALSLVLDAAGGSAFFRAHLELLLYHVGRWDPTAAQEHARQAERVLQNKPSADTIAFHEVRAYLDAGLGRTLPALESTRIAAELALKTNDTVGAVRCWANFALVMAQTGEQELANQCLEQALEIIRSKNVRGLAWIWTLVHTAYAAFYEGNLARGRELVAEALGAGVELPSFRVHLAGLGIAIGLLLMDDELVERCAQGDLEEYALQSTQARILGASFAFVERALVQDHATHARDLLHRAIENLERIGSLPPTGDADRLLILAAQHGDNADISRAHNLLERMAKISSVRSTAAQLALFNALAAARDHNKSVAADQALKAAMLFHDLGWPLHEARALEVAERPVEALEIYRRCGDLRGSQRLEERATPTNRQGRRKDELTSREAEICAQLVAGRSNSEIADALVISERTVEAHVSSILSKLHVKTRLELVAKLETQSATSTSKHP